MGFTEMTHAFIVASYYRILKERFGDRGLQAFVHATRLYGSQRGNRMAQRAIRDGKPLDFTSYKTYGEWASTEEAREASGGFDSQVVSHAPDYEEHIYRCPWAYQFEKMGLAEAGVLYCTYLDEAIARGFNPGLTFDVLQSVNDHDCCIHILREADFEPEETFPADPANIRDFEYHCGHVMCTFRTIAESIFDAEGAAVVEEILADFRQVYGIDMSRRLLQVCIHFNCNLYDIRPYVPQ